MSILGNDLLLAGTDEGYNLTRSLRLRSSASAYLNRTNTSTVTNNKIWTWSAWVKRGALSNGVLFGFVDASTLYQDVILFASDKIRYVQYVAGALTAEINTVQVFRDPSAWYHIVVAVDTTQATASNRFKLYVNGAQVTSFSPATYVAQNEVGYINKASQPQGIGVWYPYNTNNFYDGYLTEVNFIDGQALTPSSFGSYNSTTGVWQPARYTGTYGTNGFYLPFTDNSALTTSSNVGLGKDFSGNGNYWTTNNISITAGTTYDSMTDVPTLTSATAANFATFNPLSEGFADTSGQSIRNANLWVYGNAGYGFSTIGMTSGKWYAEFVCTSGPNSSAFGIWKYPFVNQTSIYGYQETSYRYVAASGEIKNSGTILQTYNTWTTNDVISVAYDADNGKVYYAKNGTWQGSSNPATSTNPAVTGLSGTFVFGAFANNADCYGNFGQRPFAYTPPTGFVALNTFNLPTSTIVKGNTVMDATLYTGTGSAQTITNAAGFKPDFVWQKARAEIAGHRLVDSVRGTSKVMYSNSTSAEATTSGVVDSFNSNGFTGGGSDVVTSGLSAVAWQWQAGQGTTSSNTNGSITSTVSVNASAGFSIVSYTGNGTAGATIGHGLGVVPHMIITFARNTVTNHAVYHISLGNTKAMKLNLDFAPETFSGWWNNTSPTSSVFSVGTFDEVNKSSTAYVAYCWTPIAGYSAFGSYTGNGSTDGPFIYTGFRPKFIMSKVTTASNWWIMFDSTRNPYNAANYELNANLSDAEYTANTSQYTLFDFLSNGFKLRTGSLEGNSSGQTYIYMAFAETPTKFALAR